MVIIRKTTKKRTLKRNPHVPLKKKKATKVRESFKLSSGTVVQLYSTPIVEFNDSTVILRTGGWATSTTMNRMNQAAREFGLNFLAFRKNYGAYVTTPYGTYELSGIEEVRFDRHTGKAL